MEIHLAGDKLTRRITGLAFKAHTFEEEKLLGLFVEAVTVDITDVTLEHKGVPFASFKIEKLIKP